MTAMSCACVSVPFGSKRPPPTPLMKPRLATALTPEANHAPSGTSEKPIETPPLTLSACASITASSARVSAPSGWNRPAPSPRSIP